jgi:hypothetical protein
VNDFDKLYQKAVVIGVNLPIEIQNIGTLKAKADTGNDGHCVLHGINVNLQQGSVTFETVGNKQVQFPCSETIDINIGSGNIEKRPVIKLDIKINGTPYSSVPFSVADRSSNDIPVLLGKDFLAQHHCLVDPSK